MFNPNQIIKNSVKELIGIFYYNFYKRFFKKNGNRILIYHAFGSKLDHDTYGISMSIKNFRKHISYLKDNYIIQDIVKSFSDDSDSVSITIDDGYKDTLSAIEVLNESNLPFSLFITTNFINKKDYLSDEDISDIAKLDNSTIGSHGLTHRRLATLDFHEQMYELESSKKTLEKITETQINGIAYPHGSFNQNTIDILKLLNYKWAASSINGVNNIKTNKFTLCRSEVISNDSPNDLRKKLQGFYDYY